MGERRAVGFAEFIGGWIEVNEGIVNKVFPYRWVRLSGDYFGEYP